MSGSQRHWVLAGCRAGCVMGTEPVAGWGWGLLCPNLWAPLAGLPECGLDSRTGPVSQVFRCAWLFLRFVGQVSSGPRAHARTSLSVSSSPPTASRTHAHCMCSWWTSVPRVVTLAAARTRLCLSLPLVTGSRVGMPEPPGLGDEGRPLLHPGRREAVGSWVSAFAGDSTPCGPGDLSVPRRDPFRLTAL